MPPLPTKEMAASVKSAGRPEFIRVHFNTHTFASFPREDQHYPDNQVLHRIWWRRWREGQRMPAERNVIVIRGIRL